MALTAAVVYSFVFYVDTFAFRYILPEKQNQFSSLGYLYKYQVIHLTQITENCMTFVYKKQTTQWCFSKP